MKFLYIIIVLTFIPLSGQVLSKTYQDDNPIGKLKKILPQISAYDYTSRSWLPDFRNLMREIYDSPELKTEAEKMMIEFLQSDASLAGKQVICDELGGFATRSSIPVLTGMLGEKNTAEMSLNALEQIQDVSVNKALREQLKKADDWHKPGILQTLAQKNDSKAVKLLEDHAHHQDPLISGAAVYALGKIGDEKAVKVLEKLYANAVPPFKWEIADQYLQAADHLLASGNQKRTYKIYQEVYASNPPLSLYTSSLQGMLKDPSIQPETVFLNILNSGDDMLIRAAIPILRDFNGNLDFNRIIDLFPGLSQENQVALMIAFSERGEKAVRPIALDALSNDEVGFRMGGLQSLLNTGKPEDALVFAQRAAAARGEEQEFARKCLYEMKGRETDRIILDAIPQADAAEKVDLIRSLAARNVVEGIPMLMELVKDQERNVKIEAIRTIGVLGNPEILDDMIPLIGNAGGRAELNEMIKSITLIASKNPRPGDQSDEILDAIPDEKEDGTLIAMIGILGNLGSEKALPVLRVLLSHSNKEIQYASIRALSGWPNDDPVMDLKEIAEDSNDPKKHTLALQGYIQLLSQSGTLSANRKMTAYQHAYTMARNPDEKKMILSVVGKSGSVNGLEMVTSLLNDKDLKSEAEASFISLLENIPDQYHEEKLKWMNEAIKNSNNVDFKNRIRKMLEDQN
ncbi:MAG: HEAT repeat domain-containing protein [Cyclobacteriaceae bacterium]|nr:HEAT repeat domain-containing protein [Cyclobacteriaceae bacterium]